MEKVYEQRKKDHENSVFLQPTWDLRGDKQKLELARDNFLNAIESIYNPLSVADIANMELPTLIDIRHSCLKPNDIWLDKSLVECVGNVGRLRMDLNYKDKELPRNLIVRMSHNLIDGGKPCTDEAGLCRIYLTNLCKAGGILFVDVANNPFVDSVDHWYIFRQMPIECLGRLILFSADEDVKARIAEMGFTEDQVKCIIKAHDDFYKIVSE